MDVTKPQAIPAVQVNDRTQTESPEVTALVDRAKEGDADAFGDLMRLYDRRIIALGIHMGLSRDDAQDACQDAFVKVFRYIRKFRSGRLFYRWLYRIAIHAIYDRMRRDRAPGVISIEEMSPPQLGRMREGGAPLEDRVASADLLDKLLGGLDSLTRRERVVFLMRDVQGIGTDEIGRILGLSQVTVRRHCMSARRRLRERIFLPRT